MLISHDARCGICERKLKFTCCLGITTPSCLCGLKQSIHRQGCISSIYFFFCLFVCVCVCVSLFVLDLLYFCVCVCVKIVTGSMDTTVKLWDLAAGKTMCTLTNHKKGVRSVVLHPSE